MAAGELRRHYLETHEVEFLFRQYSTRRGGFLGDRMRRELSRMSNMQLGSIVACDGLPGVDEDTFKMFRVAALLEIKDTRILTALSMDVEDPYLKERVLDRLRDMKDKEKKLAAIAEECKKGGGREMDAFTVGCFSSEHPEYQTGKEKA